jgi:hypothetical protein
MAAGLGFKDFVTGEVLTAADVDGYLMQGVWVFASAAARDAAVTSPQEGNFAYLKDTNVTTYYTGSAWANLDTTGMTNPMTTTGDTIYSSSGSTPARLGIGSTGQVLTVAGGVPSWATPAAAAGFTSKANYVITNQSTSSTTFTDLSTTQSVTLTTGTKALILLSSETYNSGTDANYLGFDVSGATTVSASNNYSVLSKMTVADTSYSISGAIYYDSLTAGSNTFTMKFKVSAGTGNFYNRCIAVIDMGS